MLRNFTAWYAAGKVHERRIDTLAEKQGRDGAGYFIKHLPVQGKGRDGFADWADGSPGTLLPVPRQ